MEHTELSVRSSIAVAVHAALAFTGIVAIVFPITALADAVLGSPLGSRVWFVALAAGTLGAVGFVVRDWSLGRLAKFIAVTFGSSVVWLVVVGGVMSLLGVAIPAGTRRPFLYAGLLALATGYVGVYSEHADVGLESDDTTAFGWS